MLVSGKRELELTLPSSANPPGKDAVNGSGFDSPVLDEEFDIFGPSMSGNGAASPFIKEELDEWNYQRNNSDPNSFINLDHGFNPGSINPSELSVQSGDFNTFSFNSGSNMSGNYTMGNSQIHDQELAELDLGPKSGNNNGNNNNMRGQHAGGREFFQEQNQGGQPIPQQVFSHTPTGEPIQSPFTHGHFDYNIYQNPQQFTQMSPHSRPINTPQQMQDFNFSGQRQRHSLSQAMDRKPSDPRSPTTPKTPGIGALNISGTPESGSVPTQPIHTPGINHRHHKSLSEVLKSNKHASLPSKVDGHGPTFQSQEAKKRRRRESHNLVERRRRDNINERIQELSRLVPQHRLEDEKVRKHLANNGPISPSLAGANVSPPQATSLLAAGGRRATTGGNITMGIPMEDKEKGPNKGDILNGSVGWTRDLMWALQRSLEREKMLQDALVKLGGKVPYSLDEDDRRMQGELDEALEKNEVRDFEYTRKHGSGLRIPNFTNLAGEPLSAMGQSGSPPRNSLVNMSPQSISPGMQSRRSGSGDIGPVFWNGGGVKDEGEFDMQMN